MTDLDKLRAAVADDEYIHGDDLEALGVDRWRAHWLDRGEAIPTPLVCVFCDAPWMPEMVELVELTGYCASCADSERVLDIFCAACTRLVYRKEV
jgi:hypothetical protein